MRYTDEQIYNSYVEHNLLNEFSQKFYNNIKKLEYKHIYILYDTNSDVLYELYITVHDNERNSERGISNEILLNFLDHCLECVPLEFLNVTNGGKHVVFDVFDDLSDYEHDGNMIACYITSSNQKAQFGNMFQDKKSVTVCDISVKTFMTTEKSGYMDFCKADYLNKAIHIPVSSTGKSRTLSDTIVHCDVKRVNRLIQNLIQPIRTYGRGNYLYYYPQFYNVLQQVNFLDYPTKISTNHTMPSIHNVERIHTPQYMFNMRDTPNTPKNRTFMNEWDVRNSPIKYNPTRKQFDRY